MKKIQKLLARTGEAGASEAEAQTCVEMAQRLMDKYHLTEEDLAHEPANDYQKVDKAQKGDYRSFCGKKMFAWERYLATFVKDFSGCPCYLDFKLSMVRKNGIVQFDKDDEPRYGSSVVWYGIAEDAMLAREIYDELRLLIVAMAVARYGNSFRGDGAAYAEGFVMGLASKLQKATEHERQLAITQGSNSLVLISRRQDLVRYKADAARDWLRTAKGIRLGKGSHTQGSNGDRGARKAGFADGQNTDVSSTRRRKIGSN